jgi:hypothetical protein
MKKSIMSLVMVSMLAFSATGFAAAVGGGGGGSASEAAAPKPTEENFSNFPGIQSYLSSGYAWVKDNIIVSALGALVITLGVMEYNDTELPGKLHYISDAAHYVNGKVKSGFHVLSTKLRGLLRAVIAKREA